MLTSCMLKWDPAAHDCMYMVLMAIEMANGSDEENHGQHEEDQRDRCNDVYSDSMKRTKETNVMMLTVTA